MKNILVTGDFLIDHHIYEGRRLHFGDQNSRGVCVKEELGGGALIHQFLTELAEVSGQGWHSVLAVDEAAGLEKMRQCNTIGADCSDQPFSSYAFWRPFPASDSAHASKASCWRVAEAMGFGGGPSAKGQWPWKLVKDIPAAPEVLVISDGGMGFRSRTNATQWRLALPCQRLEELGQKSAGGAEPDSAVPPPAAEPGWIVLKMSAPVGEGDLWRELSQFHAPRLIVVAAASELRRANVRISKGLSWEQTLEDLHRALQDNAGMKSLMQCRHLIISFDCDGALWLSNDGDQHQATFLFDPQYVEGERRENIVGDAHGQLSCLTAAVAAEVVSFSGALDLTPALRRGLAAMRHLRERGHGEASRAGGGFPAKDLVAAALAENAGASLQVCRFECDAASCPVHPGWSLLALHEAPTAAAVGLPLYGIARRVLIQGPGSLRAPTLKVGDYFTADRGEIESLRSLRQLVRRYLDDRKADKPLSIGVFGPPGAGKSFAVKELAKALLGDRLGWLEFNLSQFNGAADLIGALHQVRDKTLEGKTPVAFFDEFDSQNFDWLKFLLAPMQDGRFQEGQVNHPVGPCLFVFAGGTSHTFEEFEAKGVAAAGSDSKAAEHFRLSKGPDFASRLDARLNVIGPNPRPAADIFFPVRRALFIRSRLKCSDTARLDIHPGLVTALLELPMFKHGARSLTKLIDPFKAVRRSRPNAPLRLSTLPPHDQLALHVPLAEFDALTRRDEDTANQLGVDKLASAIHAFYRKKGKDEGWIKLHHDREFTGLSPFDQATNRAAARRIPAVLALAGLKLVRGHATPEERTAIDLALAFYSDILGEAEHDGWMEWHFDNGWTQSDEQDSDGKPIRDDSRQLHPALCPFCELSEKEKSKDRDAIRHYPEIVEIAGLMIAPIMPVPASPA